MQQVPKSRRPNVVRHPENPFLESMEIHIGSKRLTVGAGRHTDLETGESVDHSGVHIVKKIDREQFVKLYTREMKAIFELKPTALKVIQYLLAEIQRHPNADGIYLHWLSAEPYFNEKDLKVSRASFMRAISELIEKKFLAESTRPNIFWLNPRFYWNGDRYSFLREYHIKKRNH